jgi:YfiH family protein
MQFGKGKVEWIEFEKLEPYPHVLHGSFLRTGGVSEASFSSLNVSDSIGDHPDSVKTNRELIRKVLGVPQVIYANQNHGASVHRINGKNRDKIPPADALFTTEKDLGLAVMHADCQAAIFYDPVHEAIGVAHAGWRGSVQNIYAKMCETMHRELGSQPHQIIVCISPSLGPDHAEYKNYKQDFPQDLWVFQSKPNHFNFWEMSKKQLMSCGVLEKNIEISEACTFCHPNDYFSYRRDKETGRNATIVALKSS